MRYNEPIRAAGIGKKQVAFDVNQKITEQSIAEHNANDSIITSDEGLLAQSVANNTALSRVIAYSASNSAMVANQNDIWSTQSIKNWTHYGSTGISQSYIKWDLDSRYIKSPNAYLDASDSSIIRVRKKGWYLVNVHFFEGDHEMNNIKCELTVIPADSPEQNSNVRSFVYTKDYPSLHISSLISIPGYDYYGNEYSPSENYGQGGIQVIFSTYSHNTTFNITSTNSYAYIELIWLRPWEAQFTNNTA